MQSPYALPSDLTPVRDRLRAVFGPQLATHRLDPLSQMIRALIGTRTYDEVTWAAFIRLHQAFPDWDQLASADPDQIESIIDPVVGADQKARQLPILLRVIRLKRGDLDLGFLAHEPVDEAMDWLTRLPGITPKIAASTLAFSTLARPVLVVDPHVQRVTRRLGLIAAGGTARQIHDDLMFQVPDDWSQADLFELHWLLKPHGQSICSHFDPACPLCALKDICPRVGVSHDQDREVLAFGRRDGANDLGSGA